MNLFEFWFALSAVILGMALAQIAASVHKLLLAGKKVSWAPEPIMLTVIVMLVIIVQWLGSWSSRDVTSMSLALTVLKVVMLMTLYFTAASCLPEPSGETDRVDTYKYYDRTRLLSFGSIIAAYLLIRIWNTATQGWPTETGVFGGVADTATTLAGWLMYPTLYASLIVIRVRWFNILVLAFALLFFAWNVMDLSLSST